MRELMHNGTLVTVEGIDGSGKSTLIDSLQNTVFENDESVTFTREPTNSKSGELLRDILSEDNASTFTELFLFMADHADHVSETVKPALQNGELVICDRYLDSRCAYQGYTLQEELTNSIEFVYELHKEWSVIPDCTILLDIDAETAVSRTSTGEKYEVEEQLRQIRTNYQQLVGMDPERFVVVDASRHPKTVLNNVTEILSELNCFHMPVDEY